MSAVENTGSMLIGSLSLVVFTFGTFWITTSLGNDMINAVKSRVLAPGSQGV